MTEEQLRKDQGAVCGIFSKRIKFHRKSDLVLQKHFSHTCTNYMSKKVKYIYIYHCDTISKLILSFLFSSFSCFSPLSFLLTPPPPHRPPLTPSTSPSSPSPLDSLSSRESWSSQRSTLICRLFSPLTVLALTGALYVMDMVHHHGPNSSCINSLFDFLLNPT